MPTKKLNSRFITYNKLKEAKLTNTNDILKMSLEDAGKIIQRKHYTILFMIKQQQNIERLLLESS